MGDNVVRFRKEYAENVLNFLLNALIWMCVNKFIRSLRDTIYITVEENL
jgi:hypothetical protein